MISRFFIDRPIFAAVMSIFITLTGGIALLSLPIAQYPPITPPGVAVSIFYPGASAQVVADTVAAPIEQQVNGVEGMLYMSSQMGNDGSYMLTVTFDIGTDLNTALVMVQNRVQLAMPLLPTSVQNQGITIRKKTPDILNIISFYSPDGRYDDVYLSNYATIHVLDELLRIDGVSQINYQGVGNYSIRVWLDPQKLASLNMTVLDVANAIRNQNLDAPAGMLGQQPSTRTQPFELPIDTLGRLTTTEQFGDLIVKADQGQPPPSPSAPLTASTGPHGLSTLGTTGPLDTGAHSSASGVTMATGDTTPGTGKIFESGTTIGLTSSATTGMTGMGTSSGGGTTGGAQSIGGATTGGGATATVMGGGSTSLGSGASIPGTTPGVAGSGVLSATTMGRGPGRPAAGIVRLRDVGRVELGAQNYSLGSTFDGHPAVGLAIFQLPGTNALDVADRIRAKMEELKANFPEGVDYAIAYDTTPFIRESIADVVQTLLEAVMLVAMVVLVFLQNWRAALIPLIAVPVAIVGTFAVMAALGFSLNNISLFGLVLAIGIVVDDAIVVVENVERWLEQGLPPREAARQGDGRGHRPGDRGGLGAVRRVRALRVPQRHHRPVLPPVRGDHRRLDGHLGVQLADAQPGPGGHPAQAARRAPRPADLAARPAAGLVLPAVQLGLRQGHGGLRLGGGPAAPRQRARRARLRRPAGADLLAVHPRADRLHPAAGQGLSAGQRPVARLGLAAERTQEVDGPDRGDRPPTRRAWRTRSAISGQSLDAAAPTRRTSGSMFVILEPFDERRGPGPDRRRHRRGAAAALRHARSRTPSRGRLRRAAGRRAWARRRLQADGRGPRRPRAWRACSAQTDEIVVRRQRAPPGLAGAVHPVPRQHARSSTSTSTGPSAWPWACRCSDVFNTLQVYLGSLLRQRLQRVRPHLAGERPGRRHVPQPGRRTSTCSRCATTRGRWCRWARWSTCARSAARSW